MQKDAVKSVIAGTYDFRLDTLNCKSLTYTDESQWMSSNGVIQLPTNYTLEIKDPGGKKVLFQVDAFGPNMIPASKMGFACFPSGEYVFTAKAGLGVGPRSYMKTELIMCDEYCSLQIAISQMRPEDDTEPIRRIQDYLAFARNAAELGDMTRALEYQKIAKSLLRRLDCACNCK